MPCRTFLVLQSFFSFRVFFRIFFLVPLHLQFRFPQEFLSLPPQRCIVFFCFLRFLAVEDFRYVCFFCVRRAGGLIREKFLEGSIPVCDRKKVGRVQLPRRSVRTEPHLLKQGRFPSSLSHPSPMIPRSLGLSIPSSKEVRVGLPPWLFSRLLFAALG